MHLAVIGNKLSIIAYLFITDRFRVVSVGLVLIVEVFRHELAFNGFTLAELVVASIISGLVVGKFVLAFDLMCARV